MVVPSTTTLTIRIDETAEAGAVRAEVRCAQCGRVVLPLEGIYALRLTIAPDGESIRGAVSGRDGNSWSFASGTELAQVVKSLGHAHGDGRDE